MKEQYTEEMFKLAEKLSKQYNASYKKAKDENGNDVCKIYKDSVFCGCLWLNEWYNGIHFNYFSMYAGETHYKLDANTFEEDVDYAIRFLTR